MSGLIRMACCRLNSILSYIPDERTERIILSEILGPMVNSKNLSIEQIPSDQLTSNRIRTILDLCNRAYEEDLEPLFQTFGKATHLLGRIDATLVTHLMWVTRYLKPDGMHILKTAYIEMVATDPDHSGQGYATALLQLVPEAVASFDLAALCPAETRIYHRLGWQYWRGDLYIRTDSGVEKTPEARIMVLELPRTPPLDYDADLSAEWREGEVW